MSDDAAPNPPADPRPDEVARPPSAGPSPPPPAASPLPVLPPRGSQPGPLPYLSYTSRPPPPPDDAVVDLAHAVAGAALYLSMLVALKLASLRFRWDVGGICGSWAALLILSLAIAGWLAGAHGWRGALVGVAVAAVASLFFSALILRVG